ncbi:MAG: hypothetical protein N2651_07690 [Fimbriimonadales bacterium]|nr:hypothetical protein [Fimbriimonadales bacterium]
MARQSVMSVAQLVEQYQEQRTAGISPREAWLAVKEAFVRGYKKGDAEQAWKNTSGSALEQIIQGEFSRQIHKQEMADILKVQHWRTIQDDLVKRILSENLWLRGELREPYLAESQVDFVATEVDAGHPVRVLAAYSCKASLRERFQ